MALRLDRLLVYLRFAKTRSAANALIAAGVAMSITSVALGEHTRFVPSDVSLRALAPREMRTGFGFLREALNPAGDKLRRESTLQS